MTYLLASADLDEATGLARLSENPDLSFCYRNSVGSIWCWGKNRTVAVRRAFNLSQRTSEWSWRSAPLGHSLACCCRSMKLSADSSVFASSSSSARYYFLVVTGSKFSQKQGRPQDCLNCRSKLSRSFRSQLVWFAQKRCQKVENFG